MRVKFLILCCVALGVAGENLEINLETINVIDQVRTQESETDSFSDNYDFLDHQDLDQSVSNSLDDVLKNTPSANTTGGPRSSAESLQIRGLKSNKLYLYLDGARLNFSTDHSSMIPVEPEDLKSVKVSKSSSNFQNSGSLGGGLELRTKDAFDYLDGKGGSGASFSSGFQDSNNEKSVNFKLFTASKKSRDHYLISLTQRLADDVTLGDNSTLNNSSFKDRSLLIKTGSPLGSRAKFDLSLSYFNRLDSVPMNPTLDPPLEELELNGTNEVTRYTLSPTLNYKNITFNPSFTNQSLKKVRTSDGQTELREIRTSGLRVAHHYNFTQNWNSQYGLEINQDRLSGSRDSINLASYPGGKSSLNTVFFDNSIDVNKVRFNVGMKVQDYDLDSDNPMHEKKEKLVFLKKIGVEYKFREYLTSYATYSEGMNAPKIQEVYVDGLHHQGDGFIIADNYFIPNYDLEVEQSKTIELGVKLEHQLFSQYDLATISASTYQTDAKNYIYFEKVDKYAFEDETGTTRFVNTPLAELSGSEVALEYLYNDFSLKGNYTRVRGTRVKSGFYLPDLPADTFIYSLSYNFSRLGINIGYEALKALKQDRVNEEVVEERSDETPGYLIHSMNLSKSFKRGFLKGFSIYTKFENLTDEVYRKHASNIIEAGADYKVTLKYTLKL